MVGSVKKCGFSLQETAYLRDCTPGRGDVVALTTTRALCGAGFCPVIPGTLRSLSGLR